MFIPKQFEMNELAQQHEFIDEFSFGVMVSESLQASHVPFLLVSGEGEKGSLYGHFAKANCHWKNLEGQQVLIIFNGPHRYTNSP